MDDIELDGITMRSRNPAVRLDFGGFAKGVGVDFAIQRLREFGIENAVVNAGGDLRAIGKHGARAWRVGIRNPRDSGVMAAIDVQGDTSVFTSGDYERFFEYEGKRYCHIIDPRTGYPAQDTVSVTVVDNDAGRADAAATALFIAGPKDWYRIAKKMGIEGALLIDQAGVVHMTPNLRERVYFNVEPKPTIIYSDPL
jgi:thiamine biosynthesis lipoprotein